mgnify:CR=1 FL=1
MVFDKSKVYIALNADEIKPGSKGYYADNLKALRDAVCTADKSVFGEIENIYDDSCSRRFNIKDDCGYYLFYLIEEPKEKKLRPYRDTDEMIAHFCGHFNLISQVHIPPTIWIKRIITGVKYLVVRIKADEVTIVYDNVAHTLDVSELEDEYTYLDGSPCGIEE